MVDEDRIPVQHKQNTGTSPFASPEVVDLVSGSDDDLVNEEHCQCNRMNGGSASTDQDNNAPVDANAQ